MPSHLLSSVSLPCPLPAQSSHRRASLPRTSPPHLLSPLYIANSTDAGDAATSFARASFTTLARPFLTASNRRASLLRRSPPSDPSTMPTAQTRRTQPPPSLAPVSQPSPVHSSPPPTAAQVWSAAFYAFSWPAPFSVCRAPLPAAPHTRRRTPPAQTPPRASSPCPFREPAGGRGKGGRRGVYTRIRQLIVRDGEKRQMYST
jgi:hypothetical protein